MKLWVNKSGPLTVIDQLKRQIRALISSGQVAPGDILPSAKDLAAILDVNRNTVALAYKELAKEGILKTVVGSGTYVKEGRKLVATDALKPIIDEALNKAKSMGFTMDQITDIFLNRLATHTAAKDRKVLVIWTNDYSIRDVRKALETELEVQTRGILLQNLEDNPDLALKYFVDIDLVVCGINYVKRVNKFARDFNVETVGVMLTPVERIMNEILRLPKGTTVGFSCVNAIATESYCKSVRLSGGAMLKTIWAGTDNSVKLRKMIEKCQVIFATNYVYDQVRKLSGPDKKIFNIDVSSPNATNLEIISERLNCLE